MRDSAAFSSCGDPGDYSMKAETEATVLARISRCLAEVTEIRRNGRPTW
jgi:hypothetical protein